MKSEIITNYLQYNLGSNGFNYKITRHKTTLDFSYIFCDGIDCNNMASYCLVIFYFNVSTYFCKRCKNGLEAGGLVRDVHQSNSKYQNIPRIDEEP